MLNREFPEPKNTDLQAKIDLLANVETVNAPFLSCYLSLEEGVSACRRFLDRRAAAIRGSLSATEQAAIDRDLERIQRWIVEAPVTLRGVALFARGGCGEPFFLAVPLASAVQNRLSYHQVPDLGPLVSLRESLERHLLVVLRRKWIQISEVDTNAESVLLWSAIPASFHTRDRSTDQDAVSSGLPSVDLNGPLKQVESLVRSRKNMPIVLAGDAELSELLRAELPGPRRARVIDTLSVGEHKAYPVIVAASRKAYARYREDRSRDVLSRLLRGVRASRCAVTGMVASWQALQRCDVETLVLANDVHPGGQFDALGAANQQQIPAPRIREDAPWVTTDPRIEIFRLAVQQGVAIEFVPGDPALRYLGGMGCLLRQHAKTQIEHCPKPRARLRLVA